MAKKFLVGMGPMVVLEGCLKGAEVEISVEMWVYRDKKVRRTTDEQCVQGVELKTGWAESSSTSAKAFRSTYWYTLS